jgi:hypothetical protein
MAKSTTVKITISGPPYSETFKDIAARVHKRGHLWLNADDPNFTITFAIQTAGFIFDDGTNGKASGPIYISDQPDPSDYNDCGGVFTGLALNTKNYMSLKLTDANDDEKIYYYQLNFIDLTTGDGFCTPDPIMVNN